MYLSHIIPALALNLGGGHADLHPGTTNLYLEIPDIKAAIAAYEEAPIAKLFRDESVRNFVAKLTGDEADSISLSSLAGTLADTLRDELPPVAGQIFDLIPEVERLSFSISGIELEGLTEELLAAEGDWSEELEARAREVRLQAVMDFSSAEAARRSAELIADQIRTGLGYVEVKYTRGQLDWTYIHKRTEESPIAIWFATEDSRLFLGSGVADSMLFPYPPKTPLSQSADFSGSGQHFENDQGITVLKSYFRLDGVQEFPRLLALVPGISSGLMRVAEYATSALVPTGSIETRSQTRLIGSRFITESFERDFGGADTPRFSTDEPVTRESFRMAPPDAVSVSATHLDKEGVKAVLLDVIEEIGGSDAESVLVTLEDTYGFRPDRDLVDSLGGELVFYSLPFSGIGMPKTYAVLELQDSDAFARGLEGLGRFLVEAGDGAIEFNSRPYRKNPFVSIAPSKNLDELAAGSGLDWMPSFISLSLAIGVMEDRAILSLSSMYTKREMKNLLKSSEEDRHPLMDSAEEFPNGVIGYGTTDIGHILAGVYDSVTGLLPLMMQGGGIELPFEIDEMPSSDLFKTFFLPTENWDRRVEGGLYRYSESSFGPEVGLTIGAGVGAVLFSLRSPQEQGAESSSEPSARVEKPLAPEDQAALTNDRLRELKVSIVVYKSDVGSYPASLSNLFDPTANFPSGFLDTKELPRDGWGSAFLYSTKEEGSSYRLWSTGPNCIDEQGAGDDLDLAQGN